MTRAQFRLAVTATAVSATLAASPAFAQGANIAAKIDAADTAWMLGATGLVLMMTIPGLALFYAGMVRKKNVLATMAQCMAATFLVSSFLCFSLVLCFFSVSSALFYLLSAFFSSVIKFCFLWILILFYFYII